MVSAAFDKVKTLSVFEWNNLLDTALPLVKTNFTKSEITSLLMDAPGFTNSEIEQMTIPAEGTYGSKKTSDGRSLLDLDWDCLLYTSFFPLCPKKLFFHWGMVQNGKHSQNIL